MPRYEDDYGRREDPRATASRRGEPREDRHSSSRVEARDRRIVEDPRDPVRSSRSQPQQPDPRDPVRSSRTQQSQQPDPMDIVDPRMMNSSRVIGDSRGPNTAARLEPRPEGRHGGVVSSRTRDEPAYDYDPKASSRMVDPRAAEVYSREQVPSRYANPRDDRMDTDMDIPPARRSAAREVVDSRGDYVEEDHRSSRYNDYFVPGTGIDREVIQHEICRYLGNDATVRPYTNPKDGRTGFLVRAYRALTSAMIDDLKRDSNRWRQDQDRRSRSGRTTVSYAEMKGRQEADFGDTMDVDEYPYEAPTSRHRDIDPRDPRHNPGRHAQVPVSSSGYPADPQHAYSIGTGQQANYGSEGIPRYGGGNTPPTTRAMAPGYSQAGYPPRTSAATAPPMPAGAYRDPRTGQIVSGYDAGYSDQGRSRHGGR